MPHRPEERAGPASAAGGSGLLAPGPVPQRSKQAVRNLGERWAARPPREVPGLPRRSQRASCALPGQTHQRQDNRPTGRARQPGAARAVHGRDRRERQARASASQRAAGPDWQPARETALGLGHRRRSARLVERHLMRNGARKHPARRPGCRVHHPAAPNPPGRMAPAQWMLPKRRDLWARLHAGVRCELRPRAGRGPAGARPGSRPARPESGGSGRPVSRHQVALNPAAARPLPGAAALPGSQSRRPARPPSQPLPALWRIGPASGPGGPAWQRPASAPGA
jgi:hypothetical protein